MSGFFLVVEGPEGAGKSTLVRELERHLIAAGRRVQLVREPGGTPLAEAARRLVLDPALHAGPAAELFLMLAARADLVEKVIRPLLAGGTVVVADRFDLSTMAYQVAGRGLPEDVVMRANALAKGGLEPDLTILLDIPAGVGVIRQQAAGKSPDRIEQADGHFYRRVNDRYRAEKDGPTVVRIVAHDRTPDDVAKLAWLEVLKRLNP